MFDSPFIIPVVALMIPIVAIVMRHMTRWRELKVQALGSAPDGDLLARAGRLEDRVSQLERILDAEAPGWRRRQ